MKQLLLTKNLLAKLPALGTTDDKKPEDIKVPVKFFSPYSNWTWYLYEYEPGTRMFFGLVCGFEKEFGYVSLDELEAAVKKMRTGTLQLVERDTHWNSNTTLREVCQREKVVIGYVDGLNTALDAILNKG